MRRCDLPRDYLSMPHEPVLVRPRQRPQAKQDHQHAAHTAQQHPVFPEKLPGRSEAKSQQEKGKADPCHKENV